VFILLPPRRTRPAGLDSSSGKSSLSRQRRFRAAAGSARTPAPSGPAWPRWRGGYGRASYELNPGCNYDCEHCYFRLKKFAGLSWPERERLLRGSAALRRVGQ
jgi:hypothetical protein